jgi:electron transfer flavoprotein alpha/beta subunit
MNQDQITAKLSQINSKGLEASFSLSEAALENAQKLAELNYAAIVAALHLPETRKVSLLD